MDIQRPPNSRAKKIRRMLYAAVALVSVTGLTYGVNRLRPAAPAVDKATIWTDDVKRGPMIRDVHGIGNLVPIDIRWIPARTDSRVDLHGVTPNWSLYSPRAWPAWPRRCRSHRPSPRGYR